MKSLSLYQGNRRGIKAQRLKGSKSLAVGCRQSAISRLSPTAYRLLPTAYRLLLTAYCLLLTADSLFAQTLTKEAKVSLITVSPGQELYSSFGHNALWVSDPAQGIDRVYNYGTFDFRTEGFYIKFLRGTLPYQLSVSPMYYTMYGAQAENRSVTEQVLNLSPSQKQKLYDFLENNYLPENRQYAYRFFYDNCATRLRDALKAACGDSLMYHNQPIRGTFEAKSYRSWMNSYLGHKPWARFGMNLAIGLPSDHIATPQEEMYLPDNLRDHADRAKIGGQQLVLTKNRLFEATVTTDRPSFYELLTNPQTIFIILLLLLSRMSNYQKKREKISFLFDKIFFGILGFVGWFLLLLWVATDHGVTAWNPHLLWALPLHLPLMMFLGNPKHSDWIRKYLLLCLSLLAVFVVVVVVSSIYFGTIIGQPIEAGFIIIGLFYRLLFLRKRV